MLVWFETPIGWGDLLKRSTREVMEDDCLGLAAQLAYYFVLALFPALLFLVALASFFPIAHLTDEAVRWLSGVAPSEVITLLTTEMRRLSGADSGGLLTLGVLMALWSSSSALVSLVGALNRAYDIEEGRPWWKVRLTAIGLTIALAALLLASSTLIVAGPLIGQRIASVVGLGSIWVSVWTIVQWPVAIVLVMTAISLLYYFAPDAEQEWVWITPGAVVATALWLAISAGFRYYVTSFGSYNATYGALGGFIVLLLWLYLSGFAILVGAELNAEIEHASPYGKAPGEKVPGQKRRIGLAAARAFARRLRPGAEGTMQEGTTGR